MNKEKYIEIVQDINDGNIQNLKQIPKGVIASAKAHVRFLQDFVWSPPEPFCSDNYNFHWYKVNDAGDLAAVQLAFFVPDCLAYCEEFDGPKWIQVACTQDGYGEIQDFERIKERFDVYLNYAMEKTGYIDGR